MNSDFQAFHRQQHVSFHVLLYRYTFLNHLIYVPKIREKKNYFQNQKSLFLLLVHNRVHCDRGFLTLMIEWILIEMIDIAQETMMDHSKY